jgi:hypothetical protein
VPSKYSAISDSRSIRGAKLEPRGLILREGNAPLDVGPQPDYIGDTLDVIADQLIERWPASIATSP